MKLGARKPTTAMVSSFHKTCDQRRLLALYDQIENATKLYATADTFLKDSYYNGLKLFSADAKVLKAKLATYDYREDDKKYQQLISTLTY